MFLWIHVSVVVVQNHKTTAITLKATEFTKRRLLYTSDALGSTQPNHIHLAQHLGQQSRFVLTIRLLQILRRNTIEQYCMHQKKITMMKTILHC